MRVIRKHDRRWDMEGSFAHYLPERSPQPRHVVRIFEYRHALISDNRQEDDAARYVGAAVVRRRTLLKGSAWTRWAMPTLRDSNLRPHPLQLDHVAIRAAEFHQL